jgi:hypothetical protein
MFRRLIFIGVLMLPGSFFVLGIACVHPRMRREMMQFGGLAGSINRLRLAYVEVWRRLR